MRSAGRSRLSATPSEVADVASLLERARSELYQAKALVRATRNHTKVTAAALQDSEDRLDGLIAEIEQARIPTPEEAQEHGYTGKAEEAAAVGC